LITKVTNFVKIPILIGYPFLFFYFTKMITTIKRGLHFIIDSSNAS